MTDVLTEVDQLVRERLDLQSQKAKIDGLLADIDSVLASRLDEVGGTYELPECPGQGYRLQGPRSLFDEAKARAILTPEQYERICESKPSVTKARKVFGDTLVESMTSKSGKSSIVPLTRGR